MFWFAGVEVAQLLGFWEPRILKSTLLQLNTSRVESMMMKRQYLQNARAAKYLQPLGIQACLSKERCIRVRKSLYLME